MKITLRLFRTLTLIFAFVCLFSAAHAQTTAFVYQGQLNDGVTAANGTYNMQFSLYDAASGGTQIGSTLTNTAVNLVNGVFTVQLDFSPATPFASGANRFLQIAVKKPADASYTILTPRQQITSSPYSVRTLSAGASDALSAACAGCVTDVQIAGISGSKVSGTVASAASATSAGTATTATTAGNVSGTVAVLNGGTGSTTAAGARTNLGLGTLATLTPTGTASTTTFLRGDGSWQAAGGGNASALTYNPTRQTADFTINPANNFSIYEINRCAVTNVTLPTAAAAGAGRVIYLLNIVADPCAAANLKIHLNLTGGNWITYIGNTTIADAGQFTLISNGVDGWLTTF